MPQLNDHPTLADLQAYVVKLEAERGFEDQSARDKCLLLGEEVGELFKAVRKIEGLKVDTASQFGTISEELADIFWHAEKAYFSNANVPEGCEILLDPLCGDVAGPPIYLQTRMYAHTLGEYERAIESIQKRFLRLKVKLSNGEKAECLGKCLVGVLTDIAGIKKDDSMLQFPANTIDEKTWGNEWIFGED